MYFRVIFCLAIVRNWYAFWFKFFQKNKIETFFVSQNGKNQWWHTPDVDDVAQIVMRRKDQSGKKLILYGSSMGGYASCHLRTLFGADIAVAIAPQIFVDRKLFPCDSRWERDISNIQNRLRHDETANINAQLGELIVFYDPLHPQDNAHVQHLLNVSQRVPPTLVEVPYSNHDVARLLSQTKILQGVLLSINKDGCFDRSVIPVCAESYLRDHKCFFNFFRNHSFSEDQERIDLTNKLHGFLSLSVDMDFEALYMAAECLSKIKLHASAVEMIDRSIALYRGRYLKEPPSYLFLKRDKIRGNSGSTKAAL